MAVAWRLEGRIAVPDVPVLRFGVTGVTVAISVRSAAARMAARAAAVSAASLARKASSDLFDGAEGDFACQRAP